VGYLTNEQRSQGGKVSGKNAYLNKTGIHAQSKDRLRELGRKTGKLSKDTIWCTNIKTNQLKRIPKTKLRYFLQKNKDWQQGHFKNALELKI